MAFSVFRSARYAALVSLALGCSDHTATGVASDAAPLFSTDELPAAKGIGGSYTLTAGGTMITAVPLKGTGIRIPAGMPVNVVVTGGISRTATAGLKEFCARPRWKSSCEGTWAPIVAETPFPPSGAWWNGNRGAALVAWDGQGAKSPPKGASLALSGPSGSELWFGRTEYACYYVDGTLQGSCHTYGGGYTVSIRPNDGSDPEAGGGGGGGGGGSAALLSLRLMKANPSGSSTAAALQAVTSDGSPLEDAEWSFVPEQSSTENGEETPPATGAALSVAQESMLDDRGTIGSEPVRIGPELWQLPDGQIVGPGLYVVERAPGAAAPAGGALMSASRTGALLSTSPGLAVTSLASCAGESECQTTVDGVEGTFVVVGTVKGQRLSAMAVLGGPVTEPAKIVCDRTALERGEEISCEFKVAPNAKLEGLKWTFTSTDGAHVIPSLAEENPWSGVMALSGTISAEATVNGRIEKPSPVVVAVSPAKWTPREIVPDVKRAGQGLLPKTPRILEDLGRVKIYLRLTPLLNDLGIGSGPNEGIVFLKGPPLKIDADVWVNEALAPNTDFWRGQPFEAPAYSDPIKCTRRDVEAFIPVILQHEGMGYPPHPKSHVALYLNKVMEMAGQFAGLAGTQAQLEKQAEDLRQKIEDAAGPVAKTADDKGMRPPYCTFDYTYPSNKQ